MVKVIARSRTARHARGGRPTLQQAGELDQRLLEAASEMFLEHGFERTSCERIAERARAGKASLYARYPSKIALFSAVVRYELNRNLAAPVSAPDERPLPERLAAAGCAMIKHSLSPPIVAFVRLLIAEGGHVPEVARDARLVCRERTVNAVARSMAGPGADDPAAVQRALPAATLFVELVLSPLQMRALLGDDATSVARDAAGRIETAIETLDALGLLSAWR